MWHWMSYTNPDGHMLMVVLVSILLSGEDIVLFRRDLVERMSHIYRTLTKHVQSNRSHLHTVHSLAEVSCDTLFSYISLPIFSAWLSRNAFCERQVSALPPCCSVPTPAHWMCVLKCTCSWSKKNVFYKYVERERKKYKQKKPTSVLKVPQVNTVCTFQHLAIRNQLIFITE